MLKFAQQGAVLTLTHQGYPPAELKYSGSSWTYSAISFAVPSGTALINVNGAWFSFSVPSFQAAPAAWSGTTTYAQNAVVSYQGHAYQSLVASNLNNIPSTSPDKWQQNDALLGSSVSWAVTALIQTSATSPVQETSPQIITNQAVLSSQYSATLTMTPNSTPPAGSSCWGYRIYRGNAGIYGLVGSVLPNGSSAVTFVDKGDLPNFAQAPPAGVNPFTNNTAGLAWPGARYTAAPSATDYPSAVSFFEQRRVFAGTPGRPDTLFASATGNYYDFDPALVLTADSPVQFAVASRKWEQIRDLVPLGPKLLALTNSSAWAVQGSQGPLAFNDIDAKRQGEVGTSWVDPVVVDGVLLFARTLGTGLRTLVEDYLRQSYVSEDASLYARHLFEGHQIVDMAYAEDPWGLVWVVRDDGLLLSLTYVKETGGLAWAWHDSPQSATPVALTSPAPAQGGALYENVCVVPEGQEHAVYLVVNRTINGATVRYIERMATRVVTATNGSQLVALDCAGIYNGASTTSITGLTWLVGQKVWVVQDGNVDGPFTVSNAGAITLNNPGSYVIAGLLFTPEIQQLDVALGGVEVKTVDKQVSRVGFEVDCSRGLFAGPDFNDLTEWAQRQVSDAFGSVGLASSLVRQYVLGNWGTDGDACLRQTQPLPVTVISIAREVQLGDV